MKEWCSYPSLLILYIEGRQRIGHTLASAKYNSCILNLKRVFLRGEISISRKNHNIRFSTIICTYFNGYYWFLGSFEICHFVAMAKCSFSTTSKRIKKYLNICISICSIHWGTLFEMSCWKIDLYLRKRVVFFTPLYVMKIQICPSLLNLFTIYFSQRT